MADTKRPKVVDRVRLATAHPFDEAHFYAYPARKREPSVYSQPSEAHSSALNAMRTELI